MVVLDGRAGRSEASKLEALRSLALVATAIVSIFHVPAAYAHTAEGIAGGFVSGLMHPVLGLDHLAAMVAVGLWGAFLGMPAVWLLPVVFPLVMALGGVLGIIGVPLPGVEILVASSCVVLGACVALALRAPMWAAALIVGAFAIFHGHAHGTELPQAANPLAYAAGFVVATGALHLSGIVLGMLSRFPEGRYVVRGSGAGIVGIGLFFLLRYA
jgi:urease accessory protein